MGISTDQMVRNLPPKELTENVDWLGTLDSFDPSNLSDRFINECARRNPYETWYKSDPPIKPVEERLKDSREFAEIDRKVLIDWVKRIENEGLTPLTYNNTRRALIKAIGSKGAIEYNLREFDRLGEEGRKKQEEEYREWEREIEEEKSCEEEYESYDPDGIGVFEETYSASMHKKIIMIRKGYKASNGKPLVQRDFAKLLDYPIHKYAEAEKTDRYNRGYEESPVDDELLEKLVMIAHANPYWLFDYDCDSRFAEESFTSDAVQWGDQPCVYATPDVILKWIKEGKPRITSWDDGVIWKMDEERIDILENDNSIYEPYGKHINDKSRKVIVPLKIIVDALDLAGDDWEQYLDIENMEVVSVSDDRFSGFYDEELSEKIEEEYGIRYFRLPSQYEIDEYSIMEDFIWSLPEGEMQNKLVGKIRGRGAFSRFRDGIYRFGIEKDWYEYLEKAHREIAVEWCEKNGFEIA